MPKVHPFRCLGIKHFPTVRRPVVAVAKQGKVFIAFQSLFGGADRRTCFFRGKSCLGSCLLLSGLTVGRHQKAVLEISQGVETVPGFCIVFVFKILGSPGICKQLFRILHVAGFFKSGDRITVILFSQRLLAFLPKLKTVDITGADFSGAQIAALKQSFPELELTGTFTLLGQEVDPKATTLDLRQLSHDEAEKAAKTLALLSELESITLGSSADNDLTMDDIALIEAACPDTAVDYHITLWGKDVSLADEMLDLNHIAMDDQGAAVRSVLPYMTRLKVLDMDSCGVSNENMAVIRDENPDVDVVWRVWFGTDYSVRTNVTMILASKPSKGGTLYDSVGDQLKYCTKVRYLDLGHNSDIYDFNFVTYMPDLEIVVISMTGISDLTPFASCSNLKYMEAGNCNLSDLSPLAACTSLRHLNVGTNKNVKDITPLYGLDLKRLWLGIGDPVPAEQVEEMRRLHPKCEVNTTVPTGLEKDANGNQTNEGYVMGNWKCFQQYLLADWEYFANTGVFPAQRPIGWYKVVFKAFRYREADKAYAFTWNDPKYNAHDPDVAPVNTHVIDTSFLDEDFEIPETIIPDKLDDPPGELLYESPY